MTFWDEVLKTELPFVGNLIMYVEEINVEEEMIQELMAEGFGNPMS